MKICCRRMHLVLTALILSVLVFDSAIVFADPPGLLNMFRKKQTMADETLTLKAEHGPWLILASTLSGDAAFETAQLLAKDLQTTLRVPAFIMQRDSATPERLTTRYRETTRLDGTVEKETIAVKYANQGAGVSYAVLVGEFSSTEDPKIAALLKKVREHKPAKANNETSGDQSLDLNVTGMAFVTRNPLLPDDFFQASKIDKFVEDLNKEDWIKHSLLKNKGRFTVRVASFRGKQVTTLASFSGKAAKNMDEGGTMLDSAAKQAHKLTEALRAKNVDAYEFHDRFGSYVMIGSFDELGRESSPGQFSYSSEIQRVLTQYCGYQVLKTRDPNTGATGERVSLKYLDNIPFDAEGKPMAVPRLDTKALYNGSLLGGRN